MADRYNFLEEDDEYSSYYEDALNDKEEAFIRKNTKDPKKPKEKYKGHQSRHGGKEDEWELMEDDYDSTPQKHNYSPSHKPTPRFSDAPRPFTNNAPSVPGSGPVQSKPPFVPGPNTHEIRGNVIDFDRVADIQKIENDYNGKHTYGIKFLFLGKKGNSRIAWFSQNSRERDRVFEVEVAYWTSLPSYTERRHN